ncbi:hypothetical protein [Couchioplanes azureus]|uniref:hypothetical protein n=1 Tax=Couchioplanes caeruleus TaxID=56438 RepID=UPI00167109FD|nr:hypothetical protein [Couchioplanes caeruleus]GGQ48249.1 hypothetical protein GCM10010166_15520 [Couchioplanes caeruleus subsp. azureus]
MAKSLGRLFVIFVTGMSFATSVSAPALATDHDPRTPAPAASASQPAIAEVPPAERSLANANAATAIELAPLAPALPPGVSTKTWSVPAFIELFENKYGRPMTETEKQALARGCIGVTTVNLERGNINPPLGMSFGTFDTARNVQDAINDILATNPTSSQFVRAVEQHPLLSRIDNVTRSLPGGPTSQWTAVIFSKRFYSKQDPTWTDEQAARAFLPDPETDQVDMTGYRYVAKPGYVNFDYGWLDEGTGNWWHANHAEPGMKVYQSTLRHYSRPLLDFDRQVFSVTFARNHP